MNTNEEPSAFDQHGRFIGIQMKPSLSERLAAAEKRAEAAEAKLASIQNALDPKNADIMSHFSALARIKIILNS